MADWTEEAAKKCGSSDAIRNFRQAVTALCEFDHLPDYSVSIRDDMVSFRNRMSAPLVAGLGYTIKLKPDTYEVAREAVPEWDVYVIEREWRDWVVSLLEQGMEPPRSELCPKVGDGLIRRRFEFV